MFHSPSRSFVVLAPSVFLSGNEETILVVNQGTKPIMGELVLVNNPQLSTDPTYTPQMMTLHPGEFRLVKFNLYQNFTPHIDLRATFNDVTQVRTFSVSHRGGHIFVRTDKPIYNPKEKTVHVRVI
ncbi:complement C3-like, partial [Tropilaelaps mercedesae]